MALIDHGPDRLLKAPPHAWYIHVEDGEGDEHTTFANALIDDVPALVPGESVEFTFRFLPIGYHPQDDLPGDPAEHIDRVRAVQRVGRVAGHYADYWTDSHRFRFRDQSAGDRPSPLVGLEPAYDALVTDGVWLVLDDVAAENPLPDVYADVELGGAVITEFDTHDEREDVLDEFSY